MNLTQWLEYLEQCHPSSIELGLDRVAEVAGRLSLDFSAQKVVTVAGTNGKGSTVAMLAAILRAAGYTTATYSSPHLLKYNERVNLGERLATDEELCGAFAEVEAVRAGIQLTYFEFGTLAALKLFTGLDLDFIILEVGLGGRLDAVNIIDADLAIVTNIALDHTDWLGDTRELIGFEKAGVFRSGKPALIGEEGIPDSVLRHAYAIGARVYAKGREFGMTPGDNGCWQWHGTAGDGNTLRFADLPYNDFPVENCATVVQATVLLAPGIQPEQVAEGLRLARLAGRFQILDRGYQLVLDVAHNPHAAARLAGRVKERFPGANIHILIAMLADKDYLDTAGQLQALHPTWYVSEIKEERGLAAKILYNCLPKAGRSGARCFDSIGEAFQSLDRTLKTDDVLLVTGSFYTVSTVLELI